MMAESAVDVKGQGGSIWALNHAMHTDSAMTLRFHIGDHGRGAGDGDRWTTT